MHTADWHVGKTLKGRDRLDEQRAVLAEITQVAEANQVDAVLVAGDVYESSAPSAQAQHLAVRPPEKGGVIGFRARSDGAEVQLAVLPFLTQRYAVRAAEIVAQTPSENVRAYDEMIRQVVESLTSGFSDATVNLLMSHLTCVGGVFGGGERSAQSIFEYSVPATIFPVSAHYVALGHLHRRQSLPAHCPVHYSGSPIAVDFGEQDNISVVCVVEARPSVPARVTDIPITSGRRLRTVRGTLPELEAQAASFGDDYLRVWLREPTRAGLRDDTVAVLPNALEVRIDPAFAGPSRTERPATAYAARSPGQLFADYCASERVEDARVAALFGELYDEATTASNAD